mmetsp:Transcript_8578/g.13008  ORF Transcript_8578/g.13008 Transcript_8578/m.13008 type:complete len:86 (-) Transcript_8578:74-331(-)|eukprot:CAMPEP_0201534302 /NCGR_PEP_ID=MMETSP0161_2-20130828/55882_1 /ASSEMBLY_ACC=CAM_ASM_000251 /TAXON_ID=180227 /ORGANISM="Neoparamoeba aestuarina, Strain SoJaBio B1-5/56/2" /LENGTH=85 /DNA_ID=CAMNT_0047938861 /DNA_START=58 /DNA_END=315 /DNA_ORIENTATION=-
MVDVDHEISLLLAEVPRVAEKQGDVYTVKFKVLFEDFKLANTLESLCGTLKAAKRKGQCSYKPQLLLQGMSDNEDITFPVSAVDK